MLLAIETSCDETAVAIIDSQALAAGADNPSEYLLADLVSSQIKLHQAYGGVVPELAAREHTNNLPPLVTEALEQARVTLDDIHAIAATRGPGLNGCLLVGLCYAKALAFASGIPLLALNHIEGHIFAAELLPKAQRPELPLVALVVSGGHTFLVHVSEFRSYRLVAKTRDDAAGEAFDKAATILGLPYPGGPNLSKEALNGNELKYPLPIGVPQDPSSFSFSGLKTALARLTATIPETAKGQSLADLAASLQYAVVRALADKSVAACRSIRPKSFLLSGGVAANSKLRETLATEMASLGIKFCVPERRWCTDNAAMLGILAHQIIECNPAEYIRKNWAQEGLLGPQTPLEIGALPRWPIDHLFDL